MSNDRFSHSAERVAGAIPPQDEKRANSLKNAPSEIQTNFTADALDCFWNAAVGAAHHKDDYKVTAVVTCIAEGVNAIAQRLRESEAPSHKAIERRAQATAIRNAEAAKIAAAREAMRPQWLKENRAAFNKDPAGMIRIITRAVPRWHDQDIRDDIASDIAIALMDGDLPISEIGQRVKSFVSAHYDGREWQKFVSFETPYGDGNMTLGDTISADRFHL